MIEMNTQENIIQSIIYSEIPKQFNLISEFEEAIFDWKARLNELYCQLLIENSDNESDVKEKIISMQEKSLNRFSYLIYENKYPININEIEISKIKNYKIEKNFEHKFLGKKISYDKKLISCKFDTILSKYPYFSPINEDKNFFKNLKKKTIYEYDFKSMNELKENIENIRSFTKSEKILNLMIKLNTKIEDIKKIEIFLGTIFNLFVILKEENNIYIGIEIKDKNYIDVLFDKIISLKFEKIKIFLYYYFELIVMRLYQIRKKKVIKSSLFNDDMEIRIEIFKKLYDELNNYDRNS